MSGLKVLIFESDAAFAGELSGAFADLGCVARVVDDGQTGLELAVSERPDLIVLSIELPRMNGFAVCNRLKKAPETSAIPLVIISSEAPTETFEAHAKLRTRAQDYVHKPVGAYELIDRCRAFVALPEAPAGGVVIDEDIAIDDTAAVFVDEPVIASPVDAEVDALADAAFDNIIVDENAAGPSIPPPRNAAPPPAMPPAPAAPPAPAGQFEDLSGLGDDDEEEASGSTVAIAVTGDLRAALLGQGPSAFTPPSSPASSPASKPASAPAIAPIAPVSKPAAPPIAPIAPLVKPASAPAFPPIAPVAKPVAPVLAPIAPVSKPAAPALAPIAPPASTPAAPPADEPLTLDEAPLPPPKSTPAFAPPPVAPPSSPSFAVAPAANNARVEELMRELADAKQALEEVPALRKELDELRSKGAARTGGGVSTREFLELRESLNKKDREIARLEKELEDKASAPAGPSADDVAKTAALTKDLAEALAAKAKAEADAQQSQKEAEDKSAELFALEMRTTAEIEKLRKELNGELAGAGDKARASAALREELDAAKAAREESEKALAEAKKQLEESAAALKEEHEKALRALEAEHEKALAGAREGARGESEAALAKLREEHEKALAGARDEAKGAAEGALTKAREEHERALAKLREEHEAALTDARDGAGAALKEEHEKALAALKEEHEKALAEAGAGAKEGHEKELARLRDEHEDAIEKALSEADATHSKALVALKAEHTAALAAVSTERDAARSQAAEEASAAAKREADEALAKAREEHEKELAKVRGEHEESVAALKLAAASESQAALGKAQDAEQRVKALESTLAEAESNRDRYAGELADSMRKLERAGKRSARETELLEKTRRALSIALALVEQVEGSDESEGGEVELG